MFKSLEVKYPKFYQVFRFIIVIIASVLYAWNLRCFAKVADLLPGGFSGVSLLFQAIGLRFFYISIPFTIFNVALNIFPAYIAYRYIGKKFTIYSIVVIILSSVLVDILPPYIFTEDILLISVFGGIINGFAISLCLNVGTTTGGTDFISIYFSHIKGIDAWNYILLGNVVILLIAGGLFGWSIALYSIIYQFCSTQVIQFMYKRYQKMTLFIISDKSEEMANTEPSSKIVTTEEELEAYYIIRGLLAGTVPVEDVAHRDTESYFGILYKDNNRKPICRLNLDRKNKQLFIPDENKKFNKYIIENLNDIYKYKDILIESVKRYV